ncbi:Kinase D-interacting substrate of 220 kDa [Papilio machaon]|uniref:Kinase D-interacting substrate of 220 kDa n=1 Tax=Papilio machaon TaxID=76193 RepID=A0A194QRI3_PAPMA|nr:Kinase D-interacting substrate of 220 kDa [Papilio machaon]
MCALSRVACYQRRLSESGPSSMRRRDIQQGVVVGACALAGAALLANLYTAGRALAALVLPPRARLLRALRRDSHALALRPEVQALTDMVSCLDAFTGQQTRLVVVVDALDSCEQEKVLALLNSVHALCSDPKSPFILLLAIDPHIISKAVEINSRRAFSESNIGGWDYLRNMVQLPFYLQNSALRRVKTAQQTAAKRMQAIAAEDFSTSLQRSVSARRLSSTSELMSSQERIKGQVGQASKESAARARRLRPSESLASSVASGLHRAPATDLGRVLLTDDYFSDVNPRSMRRLQNVLYITGRLLKAFQIEFTWSQLASWVNLTEQWPYRTSWIIYHHETFEEHIDDTTPLKHIFEKVKPSLSSAHEAGTLTELDRDERKLEVFLGFHRSTLTAADLKIFLPFTINLDPYIKKVIKEEQLQMGAEDEVMPAAPWAQQNLRQPHSKLLPGKKKMSPVSGVGAAPMVPPVWVGWASTQYSQLPQGPQVPQMPQMPQIPQVPNMPHLMPSLAPNPIALLKTAFPNLGDVSSLRLSSLSVERACGVVRAALGGAGAAAAAALQRHHVSGLVLAACRLDELKPLLDLPFGDWELFKMLIINLRELEAGMPLNAPSVAVIPEKSAETETDSVKPRLEHQRSRPTNVEKQVTLEEQMICGALQTLDEEAPEEAPPPAPGEPPLRAGRDLATPPHSPAPRPAHYAPHPAHAAPHPAHVAPRPAHAAPRPAHAAPRPA